MLTSTEIGIETMAVKNGAGQLGCDAEQNVEIFVITADTQLVDTKE